MTNCTEPWSAPTASASKKAMRSLSLPSPLWLRLPPCKGQGLHDLEYDTMNIDPNSVAEKITSRTKPFSVHHCRLPVDMDAINMAKPKESMSSKTALTLRVPHKGRQTGSLGDVGAFNYTIKNMTTLGEAVCLPPTTVSGPKRSDCIAESAEEYKDQERYWIPCHYDMWLPTGHGGTNSSMTRLRRGRTGAVGQAGHDECQTA